MYSTVLQITCAAPEPCRVLVSPRNIPFVNYLVTVDESSEVYSIDSIITPLKPFHASDLLGRAKLEV